MTRLIDMKAPRPRFARSINVERDAGGSAIDGYLPVGRAIDTISRLASALEREDVEVALSITGPYGSGKSSLAVIIDALLGPSNDPATSSAEELLGQVAPTALAALRSSRQRLGAERLGFIRATVTAQREPVATTILRALIHGAERYRPTTKQKPTHAKALSQLRALHEAYVGKQRVRPETRAIRSALVLMSEVAPILLLIDEFGKNLEAFADAPSEADLFLLQELAEWTRGGGIPLALVTLQHMAFDEYATGASIVQRREWAKIQGRFEDIPFIDSPAQTRALIAAAFEDPDSRLEPQLKRWAKEQVKTLTTLGVGELPLDVELLTRCWPLHPIALAILPDLCERYGQNERTLFSFLAGHEPLSVATFLKENIWVERGRLPVVHLDQLYDYFVESAATMVAVSSAASRWIEIDNRIRDARGIDEAARRVLKTVGLLNLVSAGGTLRASKELVCFAASDGEKGTATSVDVANHLAKLEEVGLVTFRDFADEYRVWQGSDFDLKTAIDAAHRRIRDEPPARVVERVLPLGPLVASRHAHQTGTLRAFARHWIDHATTTTEPLGGSDQADGMALYVLGPDAPTKSVQRREDAKPVAFLTTDDPGGVIKAAQEVAAIDDVLASSAEVSQDWVAYRELIERRLEAQAALNHEFESAYGTASGRRNRWTLTKPGKYAKWVTFEFPAASLAISRIADLWYNKAPIIRNDLVNRHDLSSQAAKARRLLFEAMLAAPQDDGLGITGFGPDRTLYLSVLRELGFHQNRGDTWEFAEPPPSSPTRPAWDRLSEILRGATAERVRVSDIYDLLAAPPYGIRPGIAPILLVIGLIVCTDEVALYEHGTFKPALSDEICERLVRNPGNFEIKHFASRSGNRALLLTAVADRLGIKTHRRTRNLRVASVLAVLSNIVALMNTLPEHVKRTSFISEDTQAVRSELLKATEPDELFFSAMPRALGMAPIPTSGDYKKADLFEVADRLGAVVTELKSAYSSLLIDIRRALQEEFRCPDEGLRESLSGRAREIKGKVIDPKVARLVVALTADIPGEDEWAEYVSMNVTGTPPAAWTDDDRQRFFSLIHDVGGTFRRLEALNADLRSRGDGFDALRVTVTRPDGAEAAKLVWVDSAQRAALAPILQAALDRALKHSSSVAEARDLLLAMLAEGDLLSERPKSNEVPDIPAAKVTSRSSRKGRVMQ
jgi:hypothetical protein